MRRNKQPKDRAADVLQHLRYRVQVERRKRNLSLRDLGESLGSSAGTVKRFEDGIGDPTALFILTVQDWLIDTHYKLLLNEGMKR